MKRSQCSVTCRAYCLFVLWILMTFPFVKVSTASEGEKSNPPQSSRSNQPRSILSFVAMIRTTRCGLPSWT